MISNSQLGDCCTACLNRADCQAFTFFDGSSETNPNTCYLKSFASFQVKRLVYSAHSSVVTRSACIASPRQGCQGIVIALVLLMAILRYCLDCESIFLSYAKRCPCLAAWSALQGIW